MDGKQLRNARKTLQMTVDELCGELGIHRNTLYAWEASNPPKLASWAVYGLILHHCGVSHTHQ